MLPVHVIGILPPLMATLSWPISASLLPSSLLLRVSCDCTLEAPTLVAARSPLTLSNSPLQVSTCAVASLCSCVSVFIFPLRMSPILSLATPSILQFSCWASFEHIAWSCKCGKVLEQFNYMYFYKLIISSDNLILLLTIFTVNCIVSSILGLHVGSSFHWRQIRHGEVLTWREVSLLCSCSRNFRWSSKLSDLHYLR